MTEAARVKMTGLLECVYSLIVIPAKAGIQEGEAGMGNRLRYPKGIPALREWIIKTTGFRPSPE